MTSFVLARGWAHLDTTPFGVPPSGGWRATEPPEGGTPNRNAPRLFGGGVKMRPTMVPQSKSQDRFSFEESDGGQECPRSDPRFTTLRKWRLARTFAPALDPN